MRDPVAPLGNARFDGFCQIREIGPLGMISLRAKADVKSLAKAIKAAKVVGFADLGMEAIYEFTVQDMPVTVAVDSTGESVHKTGPREWQARIGKIPVVVE